MKTFSSHRNFSSLASDRKSTHKIDTTNIKQLIDELSALSKQTVGGD
jgi:hypothetical protein